MKRLDPLLEETAAALLAAIGLGGFIALLYWLTTGLSPWPMVVLGETAGLGFGLSALIATSPRRQRR